MKKEYFGHLDTKDERQIREMEEALKKKYSSNKKAPDTVVKAVKSVSA